MSIRLILSDILKRYIWIKNLINSIVFNYRLISICTKVLIIRILTIKRCIMTFKLYLIFIVLLLFVLLFLLLFVEFTIFSQTTIFQIKFILGITVYRYLRIYRFYLIKWLSVCFVYFIHFMWVRLRIQIKIYLHYKIENNKSINTYMSNKIYNR